MTSETINLLKELQKVSEQNVTVINTVTATSEIKNGFKKHESYEKYKLVFWDKHKVFIDNLKQLRNFNTETELQTEIKSLIFNLS